MNTSKTSCIAIAFLALPLAISAQTATLHVSGQLQSQRTSTSNFGRMKSGYRAADWVVSNRSAVAVKIPLPLIMQQVIPTLPAGISVLSPISNASVVADAQGASVLGRVESIGGGVVSAVAGGVAIKLIPLTGWGAYAVYGAAGATILLQTVFPAFHSHALQSITGMLPSVLALDPYDGTVSGMVIVERTGKTPWPMADLDKDIQVTVGP